MPAAHMSCLQHCQGRLWSWAREQGLLKPGELDGPETTLPNPFVPFLPAQPCPWASEGLQGMLAPAMTQASSPHARQPARGVKREKTTIYSRKLDASPVFAAVPLLGDGQDVWGPAPAAAGDQGTRRSSVLIPPKGWAWLQRKELAKFRMGVRSQPPTSVPSPELCRKRWCHGWEWGYSLWGNIRWDGRTESWSRLQAAAAVQRGNRRTGFSRCRQTSLSSGTSVGSPAQHR